MAEYLKSNRFVAKIEGKITVRQYYGLPPQLSGGTETRTEFSPPILLLIEQESDGASLYRYAADGQVVGDTFHETLDDARQQARFEYGDAVSDWKQVPDDVENPFSFGIKSE